MAVMPGLLHFFPSFPLQKCFFIHDGLGQTVSHAAGISHIAAGRCRTAYRLSASHLNDFVLFQTDTPYTHSHTNLCESLPAAEKGDKPGQIALATVAIRIQYHWAVALTLDAKANIISPAKSL